MAVTAKLRASDYITKPDMPEAAPGIERSDAEAVNAPETRSLYAAREKIYAKRAFGAFRTTKWGVMVVTLGIYYLLPWLHWDRGPHLSDHAVLIDFENRRFFFFFLEICPRLFMQASPLSRQQFPR